MEEFRFPEGSFVAQRRMTPENIFFLILGGYSLGVTRTILPTLPRQNLLYYINKTKMKHCKIKGCHRIDRFMMLQ